jgi:hypothetical protein
MVGPLLEVTRRVPIVFTQTPDPVGQGFVDSLARRGGNATGFTLFEYGTSGKWLELLKEIAPTMTRAAVLHDPAIPQGIGQLAEIQSAVVSVGVEVTPVNVRDAGEIKRDIAAFSQSSNGGLIVTASGLANVHRKLIIALAAQHRLLQSTPPLRPLGVIPGCFVRTFSCQSSGVCHGIVAHTTALEPPKTASRARSRCHHVSSSSGPPSPLGHGCAQSQSKTPRAFSAILI